MENAKESWSDVENRGPGSNICLLRVPEEEKEREKKRKRRRKRKREDLKHI